MAFGCSTKNLANCWLTSKPNVRKSQTPTLVAFGASASIKCGATNLPRDILGLGRRTWIVTAKETIVTKFRWALFIGREKDVIDARGVIAVQGDAPDWPYVERWCDVHGSRPLLEKNCVELRERLPPS